jgi:hypothetical protein
LRLMPSKLTFRGRRAHALRHAGRSWWAGPLEGGKLGDSYISTKRSYRRSGPLRHTAAAWLLAAPMTRLGCLFHALANEAAAFQKSRFLLFRLKTTVLLFLCEKPTSGGYLPMRFWCRGRRLCERRKCTKRNKCHDNRRRNGNTKHKF